MLPVVFPKVVFLDRSFSIHMNDLPDVVHNFIKLFVDDAIKTVCSSEYSQRRSCSSV